MKVVINKCFGGFGLSQEAYKKLIEYGVPVKKYIKEERNPETGRYDLNENGSDKVIYKGGLWTDELEYWDTWIGQDRSNPLLIKVVKELGKKANGGAADLKIVTIPDGIDYEISEYDGNEHIAEAHQTWS